MTEVFRLVYCSSNRISGTESEIDAAVQQILATSRRNNAKVDLTGALMFNMGLFTQVLEGAPAAAEALFERIQHDTRHGEVTLLEFVPVEQRTFTNWSMAFVGGAGDEAQRYGAIAAESGFDPKKLSGEQLFEQVRDLLMGEGSRAA